MNSGWRRSRCGPWIGRRPEGVWRGSPVAPMIPGETGNSGRRLTPSPFPWSTEMKHLLAIPLVVLSFTLPATRHEPTASMCRVRTLVDQPGYRYTVEQIRHLVGSAEVIVRAEAVDSFRVFRAYPPEPKDTPMLERLVVGHHDLVRFRTIEVLRWPDPAEILGDRSRACSPCPGPLSTPDDFNTLPVPYGMVRPSGQRGSCYTSESPKEEGLVARPRESEVAFEHKLHNIMIL